MPKRSSSRNEKEVLTYEQAREVPELVRFATGRMPNYVESVAGATEFVQLRAKANEWGLPLVLVFSDKAGGQSSSTLRALSAEFRRRVLIGELRATRHAAAVAAYKVTSFPTLVCLAARGPGDAADMADEERSRFAGKQPTFRRLLTFIEKCALRKPVLRKPSSKEEL